MPGCAAVGCNNRSEKGYIMKCFPRNPRLRKIWQERVARADWEPSNNSFLCHVHFEPEEWWITQTGRLRLKKNAIPSIFTITSTRKSPRKRTKIFVNSKNTSKGECDIECMDNDTENSFVEHLVEKDLNFQETVEPSIKVEKEGIKRQNIVMIGEDNFGNIHNLIKKCNLQVQSINNKKEVELSITISNSRAAQTVKEEIKLQVMDPNTLDDSYDEIEKKLKQICDGESTEDWSYKNKDKEILDEDKKENEEEEKMDTSGELINVNHKTISANTSHDLLTEDKTEHLSVKEENVEIIFGVESGNEEISIPQNTSKTIKVGKDASKYGKVIGIKDERKVFNEDIEENFTKDEVHVIPNIRAAMKRKRRTREEIMKSIKKSIKNVSDQDADSSGNSESSEQEVEIRNSLLVAKGLNNISKRDAEMEAAKFVIRVSGDPDDVTEIIEELSSNAIEMQTNKTSKADSKNEEDNTFITSTITVISPKNSEEIVYSDLVSPLIKNDCYATIKEPPLVVNFSPCEEKEFKSLNLDSYSEACNSTCLKHTCTNKEEKQIKANSPSQTYDYKELLETIQLQEEVIEKLSEQFVIVKKRETESKNSLREIQARGTESKINTRSTNVQTSVTNKKNLESKQRLIDDLSDRVNHLEEQNKKLMRNITVESQQNRKLQGHIKQRDGRIKELNWKLEKASKYLERAEKNTNTYRRKMLNMQTIMRRRKLLDEKMSKFNEMLIDSSKQELSEKFLTTAADIRKSCGQDGYNKLISYGFPLPPFPTLTKGTINEVVSGYSKNSDLDNVQNLTNTLAEAEKVYDTNNESEVIEKTITGTVQDIFDENNDGDDFTTNELREHFILQLNAVM